MKVFIGVFLILLANSVFADIVADPEKVSGWVVTYETDSSGATVRGSLDNLINAVKSGGDIKIVTNDGLTFRTCQHVHLFQVSSEEHVGCEINNQIALKTGSNPISIRSNPYFGYSWFDTYGNYGLARSSIYGGANLGQTTQQNFFGIIWFARVR